MDFRWTLFAMLLVAMVGGCRGNQLERELLERELRYQEDLIFELEEEIRHYERKLRSLERKQPGEASSAPSRSTRDADAWPTRETFDRATPGRAPSRFPADPPRLETPPKIELPPGVDPTQPPTLDAPRRSSAVPPLEALPEIAPPGTVPEGLPPRSASRVDDAYRTATRRDAPAAPTARSAAVANAPAQPDAPPVASLTLDRNQTGGFNADGSAGDEGIYVVLQPRDASGRIVPATGTIAVVLIDPSLSGPAARVARWDFTPEQVAQQMRAGAAQTGLALRLRWPNAPPKSSSLIVFARLTTADGNQFVAEQPISLSLGGVATPQPVRSEPTLAPPEEAPAEPKPAAPPPAKEDSAQRSIAPAVGPRLAPAHRPRPASPIALRPIPGAPAQR